MKSRLQKQKLKKRLRKLLKISTERILKKGSFFYAKVGKNLAISAVSGIFVVESV